MRIGILGLGSIGQRHMRNLLQMGKQDLMACDPRIGQAGFSCAPIQGTNNPDLFWAWQPEAVLICTPPQEHLWLARKAIWSGAHCFIEKPLAAGLLQATTFAECAAQSPGVVVAIGYQLRWQLDIGLHPGSELLWECSQNMSQWPSRYEKDALLEFSHEIDAAVYISGPVDKVSALSRQRNGWHIRLQHLGRVSTIVIDPCADEFIRKAYCAKPQDSSWRVEWQFSHERNDEAYQHELIAFLGACQGRPWSDKLCTLAQAVHVMKIIEACKRSAKNCEVIQL